MAAVVLLSIATSITYFTIGDNSFHLDDYANILTEGSVHMRSWETRSLLTAFDKPFLENRKVPNVTFAIDWWRGGGKAASFLQTNAVLHWLTGISVYALLSLILSRLTNYGPERCALAAMLGATLWLVHPIQVQAVSYVVQRQTILSALFVTLSIIAYIKFRESGTSGGKTLYILAAATFLALGSLSKENAWLTPFMWLLVELTVVRRRPLNLRSRSSLAVVLAVACVTALAATDLATGTGPLSAYVLPGYEARDFTLSERLMTQPRVFFFHVSQLFLPLPERFSIEHDFAVSRSLLEPWTTMPAILGVLMWVALGCYLSLGMKYRAAGFFLLWPVVLLTAEATIIALEMVFEHRWYLPSIGIAGLVSLMLAALGPRSALPALFACCLIVVATKNRVAVWRDGFTLYSDAVRSAPSSERLWVNLAQHQLRREDVEGASESISKALDIEPHFATAVHYQGIILRKRGETESGLISLERAYRLSFGRPGPALLHDLGKARLESGDAIGALPLLQDAKEQWPGNPTILYNLGKAYSQTGNCKKAAHSFRELLLFPASAEARREIEVILEGLAGTSDGKCRSPTVINE